MSAKTYMKLSTSTIREGDEWKWDKNSSLYKALVKGGRKLSPHWSKVPERYVGFPASAYPEAHFRRAVKAQTKHAHPIVDFLQKVSQHMKDDTSSHNTPPIVARKDVKGTKQKDSVFGHVFIDQKVGSCGDDYFGHTYYPIPGTRKYIAVAYSC